MPYKTSWGTGKMRCGTENEQNHTALCTCALAAQCTVLYTVLHIVHVLSPAPPADPFYGKVNLLPKVRL